MRDAAEVTRIVTRKYHQPRALIYYVAAPQRKAGFEAMRTCLAHFILGRLLGNGIYAHAWPLFSAIACRRSTCYATFRGLSGEQVSARTGGDAKGVADGDGLWKRARRRISPYFLYFSRATRSRLCVPLRTNAGRSPATRS